jgi:uncharacterized protein YfaS (alpha-2-macroglobulin family)
MSTPTVSSPRRRRIAFATGLAVLLGLAALAGSAGGRRVRKVPDPVNLAATSGSASWKEVDRLVSEQKFEEAAKQVDLLLAKAKREKNEADWTRALLTKVQLRSALHGWETSVRILAEEPWPEGALSKAAVRLFYAKSLVDYVSVYSWEISQRERVEAKGPVDLKAWTRDQIAAAAAKEYEQLLGDRNLLGEHLPKDLAPYLVPNSYPDGVRPSLRDAVAYLFVELAANSSLWRPEESNELFRLPFDRLLRDEPAPLPDGPLSPAGHPIERVVAVLSDLEAWHLSRDEREAALEARLERIRRVGALFTSEAEKGAVRQEMETRLRGLDELPWWSEGMAELAELVRGAGDAVRGREIALAGEKRHPGSFGAQRCRSIVASIEAPDFQIQTMTSDGTGRRSIEISHRNLRELHFRAWWFDLERRIESSKDYNLLQDWSEMRRTVQGERPAVSWKVELPATPDYQSHRTFVTPMLGRKGAFLVAASARPDFAEAGNRVMAFPFFSTDLVLRSGPAEGGGLEVTALFGSTGRAAAGTEVSLWQFDWQKGHHRVEKKIADPSGRVRFPYEEARNNGNLFLVARKGEDWALDRNSIWLAPESRPSETSASLVYTDRSIYRPGQKIFWKVVAWRGGGESSKFRTQPDVPLTMFLRDANGQEIEQRAVTTNRYGSASGEFVVPTGKLLGAWQLQSSLGGGASVRVEEYKRPTFEVSIKEPASALRINRKAELTGEARYYFGLPVASGKVRWRIEREPVYDWYWHFCSRWWDRWSWWGGSQTRVQRQMVAQGVSELAADGTFPIVFTPEVGEKEGQKGSNTTWNYSLSADVTDEGGETRSASRSFRLGFVAVEASLVPEKGLFLEGMRETAGKGDFRVVRSDLDGTPRGGAGDWTLLSIAQPDRTVVPSELPIPLPPGGAPKVHTPGDLLRPRWEGAETLDALLRSWPDGRRLDQGRLVHDAKGEAWISLPELAAGAYRIRYRTKDDFGADYETTKDFVVAGKRSTPLAAPAVLELESGSVPVGGTARILVRSGLADQPMTLDFWRGGRRTERRELLSGRDAELVEIPIREKDRGGFGVTLSLVRDHQAIQLTRSVFVPWDDRQLEVGFATFRDRLRPGQTETWKVTVKGAKGEAVDAGAAELLAYMYDRSLDLFAPHYPASPLSLYPNWSGAGWFRTNLGSQSAFGIFESGFVNVPGYPSAYPDRLSFFESYGIGGMGRRGFGGAYPASAPMMMKSAMRAQEANAPAKEGREEADAVGKLEQAKGEMKDKKDALASNEVAVAPPPPAAETTLRSNFSETAFWKPHLVSGANGEVSFEFTVPDSVTSWNVWVHAITNDLRAGSLKKETKSVKELMVRPYLPRFLREGDEASLKVVVNNAGEKPLSGRLELELLDPETNRSLLSDFGLTPAAASKTFQVAAGGGTDLTFAVRAPVRVGNVAVKVVAKAGDLSDGELRPIPLLPGRLHLAQSRFVTLKDRDRREMTFEDLARGGDPSLINEQMVVTVDAQLFYSVLTALPYLVNYPYECTEQTLNRFLSTGIVTSVFDSYPSVAKMAAEMAKRDTRFETFDAADPNRKLALEETPWVAESKGGTEASSDLINVLDPRIAKANRDVALAKLRKAQTSLGAWPWWEGGPPSPWMTLYILNGFSRALEFGVDVPKETVVKGWSYLHRHYVDELVRLMMSHDCCWEFVTFLNYALSSYPDESWSGGVFTAAERKQMLDFSFRHWKEHSPLLKGYLTLTLKRAGRAADAKLVFDSVMDSAKTTRDEGTFWAPEDRSWLWYNDTIESHAFALRVLMELKPKDDRNDGLVQWLLLNKKLNHWKSTRATAEVIYSLVHYLKREGALGVPEDATVTVGSEKVSFFFDPAKYTGKKNQVVIPGEKIDPKSSSTVVVEKTSKGFAFASATWHFSTEKLPEEDRGDFFHVSRRYFRREVKGSEWVLVPLAEGGTIAVGDQLEVQLSIRSKHEAEYVHLRDPRGAGFEPESPVSRFRWDLGIGWYEEIRDSATNFFFERLPVGEYTFKYRVRAATAGTFRVGPATLSSMYAPEFTAYSAGAKLAVGEGK